MGLNISKCAILTCSRLLSPSTSVYTINHQPLTCVTQHPYLGVTFDSTMSFSPHITISNIICKAMRVLNFVKRNLHKCNRDTNVWLKSVLFNQLWNTRHLYGIPTWIKISYPLKRYKGGQLVGWNLTTIGIVVLQQCSVIFNGLLFHVVEKYQDWKYFIMPSTITQLLKSHTTLWLLLMPHTTSIHYILWLPL